MGKQLPPKRIAAVKANDGVLSPRPAWRQRHESVESSPDARYKTIDGSGRPRKRLRTIDTSIPRLNKLDKVKLANSATPEKFAPSARKLETVSPRAVSKTKKKTVKFASVSPIASDTTFSEMLTQTPTTMKIKPIPRKLKTVISLDEADEIDSYETVRVAPLVEFTQPPTKMDVSNPKIVVHFYDLTSEAEATTLSDEIALSPTKMDVSGPKTVPRSYEQPRTVVHFYDLTNEAETATSVQPLAIRDRSNYSPEPPAKRLLTTCSMAQSASSTSSDEPEEGLAITLETSVEQLEALPPFSGQTQTQTINATIPRKKAKARARKWGTKKRKAKKNVHDAGDASTYMPEEEENYNPNTSLGVPKFDFKSLDATANFRKQYYQPDEHIEGDAFVGSASKSGYAVNFTMTDRV